MTDFAAYVFYVNRPELLRRAVESFPALWPALTVVDNSGYGIDTDLPDSVSIFRPPVPLTYAQSMNWMLQDCVGRGRQFIVHFHSDATTTNPTSVQELLTFARRVESEGQRWACLWTFYDILWLINPVAFADIGGADPLFTNYFQDQDNKRRWRLRGWECINTNIQGMSHEGSATINSDPKLQIINGCTFPQLSDMYLKKWGGPPEQEIFTAPFNRPDLFGDMKP